MPSQFTLGGEGVVDREGGGGGDDWGLLGDGGNE